MADETRREIPIEDGNAEAEEMKEKAAQEQSEEDACKAGAAEDAGTAQSDGTPEENGGDAADGQSGEKADQKAEEKADEKTGEKAAEEQESERYMRLMAEFQNFRKRAAREKADIHAYANEKIIGELLPVLDNFERALATETDDADGYAKGMELIFTQLKTALENAGLKEIPALGEEFDPNFHNAVMTETSEEHEDGKISKVLQKGYTLNDKVIRPSMVAVVRN